MLWLSTITHVKATEQVRVCVYVYVIPAFILVCGYMHMHKQCMQASHACVCLWHSSTIVFAAHSHIREKGARYNFQCST